MVDSDNEGRPLERRDLGSDQAIALLGSLASKHLLESGVVSFYTDKSGVICVAPPGEVTLDALPEVMAIQELTHRGYTDSQMIEYLKGRDARLGRA
jgi:hypothetical protein